VAHRVLLRGGERGERADVAPVGGLLEVLHAGDAVLREIVGVHALGGADARQEVAAEVGVALGAAFLEQALEHLRVEEVVAHGGVRAARVAGDRRHGGARLLAELAHAPARRGGKHAEARRLLDRHGARRDGHVGAVRPVEGHHLAHVHAVDVVGGEDRD